MLSNTDRHSYDLSRSGVIVSGEPDLWTSIIPHLLLKGPEDAESWMSSDSDARSLGPSSRYLE